MELADYSRFFFALAFVLGLIWAFAYATKRFGLDKKLRGITGAQGRLQLHDVMHLDPKRKIAIVRAGKKEYVVLMSGDNAVLLDTLETPHEAVV